METIGSLDAIFSFGGNLVMPFWMLMIFLPHWRWTQRIMRSPLIAVPPAVIYTVLVLPNTSEILGALGGLNEVMALLATPFGTTVGWMHFLAFDLFVGRWAYLDSRERSISALVMAPILFLTLMLGPIGFLLYLTVRFVYQVVQRRSASMPISTSV